MKQPRSLFRHFLKLHFLFILLPPIVLMVFSSFFGTTGTEPRFNTLNLFYITVLMFTGIIVAFVVLSWLFFWRLRKRLTRLQEAMSATPAAADSWPGPVLIQKDRMDEIDQLGGSFNRMIRQLEDSRRREQEEAGLRQRLIANMSHDLRTPLTIMRGHVTRLNKEPMSPEGQSSLAEINQTITRTGELMDDLLSYTLLTSGKYPFEPAPTDMGRLVRASVAAWYPVFEEHGIQVDVDLPAEETFHWTADPGWMTRVLDNLFQNIIRHAADGKYAWIAVDVQQERILVADRGPGMDHSAYGGGAGIGLSTVHYMLNTMNLKAEFNSSGQGTNVVIGRM
ncbi:integral membrane sensor signal transduction histidine kinase [Paenibacillus sp. FSL R7-277]|uniref:histidine kinase dimerization/phospho-acceptor domain-containing protein n=1 Tax=Paenibacillus sp. FSL R7-277 TaxID=1227352 RepID=UPI0003E2868D|nr:histidine kinase dimerization/phospho-acceptor domain-containing protein [Paenibacillus sp. FSL R7-277]ETT69717.1 integral membrane sensor signal transduction histidine kinase [Paenibacillus sp. FSL R7-277]